MKNLYLITLIKPSRSHDQDDKGKRHYLVNHILFMSNPTSTLTQLGVELLISIQTAAPKFKLYCG